MQNLKGNSFVISKLTWGIRRILTRALKKFQKLYFSELLLIKLYNDEKLEEKLTSALENDMTNLANFYQSTRKSKNLDFNGILLIRIENVWP